MPEKATLLDFTLPALTAWLAERGQKPFRARQVYKWIHQRGVADFEAMTDLAKSLRAELAQSAVVRPPTVLSEHRSADGTVKWLFDVGIGNGIETVFIPEDDRGTLCISSQVGCALDCKFCSTGRQGFNRDLGVAEIIGQLWVANRRLEEMEREGISTRLADPDDPSPEPSRSPRPVSNVVMMGMGEPLNNFQPVVDAMAMMLKGVNDAPDHAKELARLLKRVPSKVNLIPFNPFPDSGFETTDMERVKLFQRVLLDAGYIATIRKTRGDDIDAACGQLAGQVVNRMKKKTVRFHSHPGH